MTNPHSKLSAFLLVLIIQYRAQDVGPMYNIHMDSDLRRMM